VSEASRQAQFEKRTTRDALLGDQAEQELDMNDLLKTASAMNLCKLANHSSSSSCFSALFALF